LSENDIHIRTPAPRGPPTSDVCRENLSLGALALHASAEMIRKALSKSYRNQEIDFQVGDVVISFENPVLLEVMDRQQAACV